MSNKEAKIFSATAVIGALGLLVVESIGNKPIVDPRACLEAGRQVIPLDGELTRDVKVVRSLQDPNNPDCGNITTTLRDTQEGSVITSVISHPSREPITVKIGPEYYNPRKEVVIAWTDGRQRFIATLDGLPADPRRK